MPETAVAPRALDHLVMPTADLGTARTRLAALGFTVAPQGVHPFGTVNACVYFADGTFIEPLAVGDAAAVEKAVSDGNSFVARDRMFRTAHGEEGLSAIVLSTKDAADDHDAFMRLGISGGDMVEFSRPSVGADGKADTASFRLAFATDGSPGAFLFTCERRRVPAIDRSALECHPNTAVRIAGIHAVSDDTDAFARVVALASDSVARPAGPSGFVIDLANGVIDIAAHAGSTRLVSVTFGVGDLDAAVALFSAKGIGYEMRDNRILVPATTGQGADFLFEETK
jgi:hypothetical protein